MNEGLGELRVSQTLFYAYLWHFPFLPVLENKRGKVLKINVHFLFSGFVGSERKSIFYKRVDNPL